MSFDLTTWPHAQALFNRVDYLLEAFPEQPLGLIMGEALGARQNKYMGSRECANNDPGNLAYKSRALKRCGHLRSYEPGRYLADGHSGTFDTCHG
jgi:hypothetical protein